MTENDPHDIIRDQPKLRTARIITPLNILKQKVGTGGLDAATLMKAEQLLTNHTIDFTPIANGLLDELDAAVESARKNKDSSEDTIEALIYPAAQFLALGSVFKYPLISDISDNLVSFLETITAPTEEVLEIVDAHRKTLSVILAHKMTGKNPPQGKDLKFSLIEACLRYYKARK